MSFVSDYIYFTEALIGGETSDEEATRLSHWLPSGARVLDVGCGYGRLTRRLARKGFDVTGVEVNAEMLEQARAWDEREGIAPTYLHADARDVQLKEPADAAICWFTTFGVFDDGENQRLLESVHRNLRDGAPLLIDVIDRDFILQTMQTWSVIELDESFLIERHKYDADSSRMHVNQTVIRGGIWRHEFSLRLYDFEGLRLALRDAGFKDIVDIAADGVDGRLQVCAIR